VESKRRRIILTGDVPGPDSEIPGCAFASRCPVKIDRCEKESPALREIASGHSASCFLA